MVEAAREVGVAWARVAATEAAEVDLEAAAALLVAAATAAGFAAPWHSCSCQLDIGYTELRQALCCAFQEGS